MIDPDRITNFGATTAELEESLLFWICVAGKPARVISKALQELLEHAHERGRIAGWRPFEAIRRFDHRGLPWAMRRCGIGCFRLKARAVRAAASSGLDLASCSVEDLEGILGVGPKTARCFVIHSREGARLAGLDTHILKFLRSRGVDAPASTPTGRRYAELEREFLRLADEAGKSPADFDLEIWRRYRA